MTAQFDPTSLSSMASALCNGDTDYVCTCLYSQLGAYATWFYVLPKIQR
jgi:hypothetical protein